MSTSALLPILIIAFEDGLETHTSRAVVGQSRRSGICVALLFVVDFSTSVNSHQ
jgi:hypothetical protein